MRGFTRADVHQMRARLDLPSEQAVNDKLFHHTRRERGYLAKNARMFEPR